MRINSLHLQMHFTLRPTRSELIRYVRERERRCRREVDGQRSAPNMKKHQHLRRTQRPGSFYEQDGLMKTYSNRTSNVLGRSETRRAALGPNPADRSHAFDSVDPPSKNTLDVTSRRESNTIIKGWNHTRLRASVHDPGEVCLQRGRRHVNLRADACWDALQSLPDVLH